jgi:hypothetical protein
MCSNKRVIRSFAAAAVLIAALAVTTSTVRAQSAAPVDLGPCCDSATGACPAPQYQGGRVALIFGSNEYPNFPPQFSPLKNGRNDAVALARVLKKQGFSVQCILEPTKPLASAEISLLRGYIVRSEATGGIGSDDPARALIYVASHGAMIDGAEYVFFRNQPGAPIGDRYENSRYSIEAIQSPFSGLNRFDLTLIVDACRSNIRLPAPAGTPATTTRGTGTFDGSSNTNLGGTPLFRAYSTFQTGVAIDWIAGNTETERNSLYMSQLLRFLDLSGIDQELIFKFTEAAVARAGFSQNPGHYSSQSLISSQSWTRPQVAAQCARIADTIWKFRAKPPCTYDNAAACRMDICAMYSLVQPSDTQTRACLANWDFLLGSKIDQYCTSDTAAVRGHGGGFVTLDQPLTQGTDLARIEALSVTNTFASTTITARSSATNAAVASSNRAATNIARGGLLNLDAISSLTARVRPLEESLSIRNLPHAGAGSITTVINSANEAAAAGPQDVQIDCQAATCDEKWVGLRYGKGSKRTLGWVPADAVRLAEPAKPRIEVKYKGTDFYLDTATTREIQRQLNAIDLKKPVTVWLTAPKLRRSEDAYLSEARLVNAQAFFNRAGVPPGSIIGTLLTSEQQLPNMPALTIRIDGSSK